MMTKVKVLAVGYSSFNKCAIIQYQREETHTSFAALAEGLSVKRGDTVWLLRNDRLTYKGFDAVAVLHA